MSDAGRLWENQNHELYAGYGTGLAKEHRFHATGRSTMSSQCHFPGQPDKAIRPWPIITFQNLFDFFSAEAPLLATGLSLLC